MKSKFILRANDYLGSKEGKKQFNEEHFAESAPRYDFAAKVLSFGRDASWKETLVEGIEPVPAPVCLDVACGTGDVTFLLSEKFQNGTIVGLDLTSEMIDLANKRNSRSNVTFVCSDMCQIDFDNDSVDVLTGSYAIRNAPDLCDALREFRRVLKPGGILAILDFSKPPSKFMQKIQYALLRFWGGLWGLILHGNHEVHGYISKSLRAFPDQNELAQTFRDCGFEIRSSERLFGGMLAITYLV